MAKWIRRLPMGIIAAGAVVLLNSCSSMVLFHPHGPVGHTEESLIITASILMAIVVVPVMVMAVVFARRYRASNTKASYAPEWSHSKAIEAVVWVVPGIIVVILSVLVWIYSHSLNPYRPLPVDAKPVQIEVVSLDWKWLFIYPQQGIATVNEIAFPVNTPVHFYITSATVMNSFFIPQLGSQIMAMPGMQTQLYLQASKAGTYQGISAQYSGAGFSGMTFKAVALPNARSFTQWLDNAKQSGRALDPATYAQLAKPSRYNPVSYYSSVSPKLFHGIIMRNMDSAPPGAAPPPGVAATSSGSMASGSMSTGS